MGEGKVERDKVKSCYVRQRVHTAGVIEVDRAFLITARRKVYD